MNYIKNILFSILLSLVIIFPVKAIDLNTIKIYDNAELLTVEEEQNLKVLVDSYIAQYNIDLIIMTVLDTSQNIDSYAENIFNNNGFGVGSEKEGILILLDPTLTKNQIYIYLSGKKTNLIFNDSLITNISKTNNLYYYESFENVIDKIDKQTSTYFNNSNQEEMKYSKVYDNANLLTDAERELLNKLAEEFVTKYKMDLVIVTTKNNSPAGSTKAYAEDFYDYNEFGIGSKYDGILFLIDRTYGYNDTYFLTVGEAIRIFDDARINSVLEDINNIESGYYKMFEQFIESSSKYIEKGVAESNKNTYIDKNGNLVEKRSFPIIIFIFISLIISSIIICILIFKNKMVKKATKAMEYLDQKTINFTIKEDKFITTHTTRTYIPRDTSNGSRGVGGSSTSRGSSGRSHGGGGRRM